VEPLKTGETVVHQARMPLTIAGREKQVPLAILSINDRPFLASLSPDRDETARRGGSR